MIILGHAYVKSEPFYLIKKPEDIVSTPSNSTVVFDFNEANVALCNHCKTHGVTYALIADSVKDLLFASALGASYIICDKVLAPKGQKFANEYLFDAKILLYANKESDLEWAANEGIDGIIFEEGIDYGSC